MNTRCDRRGHGERAIIDQAAPTGAVHETIVKPKLTGIAMTEAELHVNRLCALVLDIGHHKIDEVQATGVGTAFARESAVVDKVEVTVCSSVVEATPKRRKAIAARP